MKLRNCKFRKMNKVGRVVVLESPVPEYVIYPPKPDNSLPNKKTL